MYEYYHDEFYVMMMADFMSSPVWDITGRQMSLDSLKIPDDLKVDISKWQSKYDSCGMNDDFDAAEFDVIGLDLAHRLKSSLPHWDIIYHCEYDNSLLEIL